MSLWAWAVEVYGRPESEAALVALQDDHGQCVSYLLWAAWVARDGRPPTDEALAAAAALARRWDAQASRPLRAARRALKPIWSDVDDGAREGLRAQVKAVELAAERVLLNALEAMTPLGDRGGAGGIDMALHAAVAAWSAPAPAEALERLARIFER